MSGKSDIGKEGLEAILRMAAELTDGSNVTSLSGFRSARDRDALIKQLKSTMNYVKSGYFQAGRQALIDQKSLDLHKSGMLPLQHGTIVAPPSTWDMPGDWRVSGYWYDEKDPRRFGYRLQNENGQTYDAAASDPRAGLRHDNPYSFGAGFKAYSGPNAIPPKPAAATVEKPIVAPKPPEVLDAINKEYESLFGSEDPFQPKAHGGRIAKGGGGGFLDDIVKMAGKIVADEKPVIRAYHASPYDFDRFDISKVGTGIGAPDAFSRGLYFSGNEKNADHFRLLGALPMIDGKRGSSVGLSPDAYETVWRFVHDKGQNGTLSDIADSALADLTARKKELPFSAVRDYQRVIDELKNRGHEKVNLGSNMYEVDINADPASFANWDAPISEQSPVVQNALSRFSPDQTWRDVYDSGRVKSSDMLDRGVPGTIFKANDGTPNYVVYDDKLINIRRKYEDGGRAEKGGGGFLDDLIKGGVKIARDVVGGSKGIRAYHVSPHDFDEFKPSEFRGSTFFSSTPERAKRGADAARNEMVMDTATELPPVNYRTYEVEIDPSRIKGLSLTPEEHQWFQSLPHKITGDDALAEATKGIPHGMYWDDFYDHAPVGKDLYEYTKRADPPSISYEDAIKNGRDIYHQQWSHYNNSATDEKGAARNIANSGMGGHLVQDEGGLSFAINDPSIVKILRKYADGGAVSRHGYQTDGAVNPDPYADEVYNPDAEAVVSLARKVIQGPFQPPYRKPTVPSDGTFVERRPSKIERTIDILAPYVTEPVKNYVDFYNTDPRILTGGGTPEETEQAAGRGLGVASTAAGLSSVVPAPANSVRVFGGIGSRTADKPAIREAMAMESRGATPDDIYGKTGWFRGADKKWRYEIPDIGSSVKPSAFTAPAAPAITTLETKMGDYLNHPELFKAYPLLKEMPVRTFSNNPTYNGFYYPRYENRNSGFVAHPYVELNENLLPDVKSQRSTLLHEIQHAIQQKEGFAPGTNIASQPFDVVNPKYARYHDALQNDPEMQAYHKLLNSDEYKDQVRRSNAIWNDEFLPKYKQIDADESLSDDAKSALLDALANNYRSSNYAKHPAIAEVDRLGMALMDKGLTLNEPRQFLTPFEAYHHYAGETEARNVQERMNMVPEGLRSVPPWKTQDYPFEDQIFPTDSQSWKFGYAKGGYVEEGDDVDNALRIAKGGAGAVTGVMMEDAKGNQYDAQGNIIPRPVAASDAQPQRSRFYNQGPENYGTEVQPFMDYASDAMAQAGRDDSAALSDALREATRIAAQGQPEGDSRGEYNWGRQREDLINSLYGASPDDPNSPAANQAYVVNRMADFSPVALPEIIHDTIYEAGRTGDYNSALIDGALNAAFTAPVLGALGRGVKKGYQWVKQHPKAVAGLAGGLSYLGSDADAEAGSSKLITDLAKGVIKAGIRAYHGSPHNFPPVRLLEMPDGTRVYQNMHELAETPAGARVLEEYPLGRFDMSKIGTGEGAQAYGHGLYFAEHEPVAVGYRDALTNKNIPQGKHIDKVAFNVVRNAPNQSNEDLMPFVRNVYPNASDAEVLDALNTARNNLQTGHVYEVNIAADPEHFLDWDKPLSEQPHLMRALGNYDPDYYVDYDDIINKAMQSLRPVKEPTGEDIYRALGHPKTATRMLNTMGVPGIRFLDAGSRVHDEMAIGMIKNYGSREKALEIAQKRLASAHYSDRAAWQKTVNALSAPETRNLVVFDDKLISIIRKYGIAGASAMLGYNLLEQLDPIQASAATAADQEYQKAAIARDNGGRVTGLKTYDSNNQAVQRALALTRN